MLMDEPTSKMSRIHIANEKCVLYMYFKYCYLLTYISDITLFIVYYNRFVESKEKNSLRFKFQNQVFKICTLLLRDIVQSPCLYIYDQKHFFGYNFTFILERKDKYNWITDFRGRILSFKSICHLSSRKYWFKFQAEIYTSSSVPKNWFKVRENTSDLLENDAFLLATNVIQHKWA